jgi:hypothetical protein
MGINTTSTLLMIRPVQFRLNEETAVNNYYQKAIEGITAENVQDKAVKEFDAFVEKLRLAGVEVIVVEDTLIPSTPDSIFPNNWISFHANGAIGLYPMYAKNRRLERREDIVDRLENEGFVVKQKFDFSESEEDNKFLEGTGSLIFDRENRIAYAALSERTHPDVIQHFEEKIDYKVVTFTSNQTVGDKRLPIYHTNVMMAMGDGFAVICLDTIDDATERAMVVSTLEKYGKEVIEISEAQKGRFAGNMLQVENQAGDHIMVMSNAAYGSLDDIQKNSILKYNKEILSSSLDTIEALGGGSARCMMAEVFLPKK